MTDIVEPRAAEPLLIRFAPTIEEIAFYAEVSNQRNTAHQEVWNGDFQVMFVVAALAVAAGLLCIVTGTVGDPYNPTVPLLCGATYYIAISIRDWLVRRHNQRTRLAALAQYAEREYEVELDCAGVAQRSGHYRLRYDWAGIEQVTVGRDMLFLWLSDRESLVVPLRAVPEAQRQAVIDLAKGRGSPWPAPATRGPQDREKPKGDEREQS